MIEIVRAGALTTIQDLGRPGYAHLGVPRSGALDVPALVRANRLAGNSDGAAALETTLTGCAVRVHRDTLVAVIGAVAIIKINGQIVDEQILPVPAGTRIDIGPARSGVRSYVAFAGGIAIPEVLGSRSTDTLSGLGPAALRDGDVLPLGCEVNGAGAGAGGAVGADAVLVAGRAVGAEFPADLVVRVVAGPRDDWFADGALDVLETGDYRVTTRSNRVGLRLSGSPIVRASGFDRAELPSEGIVLGAIQITPDGQPVVFLADHPVTGGYPVIAVVDPADVPLLAQARPGHRVSFRGSELPGEGC